MKLLEFFGQLNELRNQIFMSGRDNLLALYGRRGARIPTHLLIAKDGNLKDADSIYAVTFQPAKLEKQYKQIARKTYANEELTLEETALAALIEKVSHLEVNGELIQKIGDMIPAKVADLEGHSRIYKYLTTDLGLPRQVYTDTFGEPPELSEDDYIPFHNNECNRTGKGSSTNSIHIEILWS